MFRKICHYFLISKSGVFDQYYYLKTYADVRKNDMDPLWHFINFGWKEGRNPSRDIDMSLLLRSQKVTKGKNKNPIIQFIKEYNSGI
jgi:hypothetical protein